MIQVICDSCKKPPKKLRDQQHFSLLTKNLCLDCQKTLEDEVKKRLYPKEKYTLTDYKKTLAEILQNMCK